MDEVFNFEMETVGKGSFLAAVDKFIASQPPEVIGAFAANLQDIAIRLDNTDAEVFEHLLHDGAGKALVVLHCLAWPHEQMATALVEVPCVADLDPVEVDVRLDEIFKALGGMQKALPKLIDQRAPIVEALLEALFQNMLLNRPRIAGSVERVSQLNAAQICILLWAFEQGNDKPAREQSFVFVLHGIAPDRKQLQ
jgi:hypothetical protein